MKFIYSYFLTNQALRSNRFFLLPLVLLTLISFSGAVSSVSAQTPAEVCRETKKMWEEYKRQESEAVYNASYKLNDELSRGYLSNLTKANRSGAFIKQYDVDVIARYLKIKLPRPAGQLTTQERSAFQREAQSKLTRIIDYVSGHTLEELHEQSERLTEQRRIRENRYNALKCDKQDEGGSGVCKLEGTWQQYDTEGGVPGTKWTITGSGEDNAKEEGGGNATGTATLTGRKLKITWTTTAGWAGYYEWDLNEACTDSIEGKLVFTKVGQGTHTSKVKRL